ncbi:MAG: amidohydrolase family protein [Solirubrobacteraceae bacterium]
MLGFGITAGGFVARLLAVGLPVVFGSDYAPSAVCTPFEMIRAALMLHRGIAALDNAIIFEQALVMAAGNAGHSLGRPGELGRNAAGQLADLVLLDTSGTQPLGGDHPVPAPALHGRAFDVSNVCRRWAHRCRARPPGGSRRTRPRSRRMPSPPRNSSPQLGSGVREDAQIRSADCVSIEQPVIRTATARFERPACGKTRPRTGAGGLELRAALRRSRGGFAVLVGTGGTP